MKRLLLHTLIVSGMLLLAVNAMAQRQAMPSSKDRIYDVTENFETPKLISDITEKRNEDLTGKYISRVYPNPLDDRIRVEYSLPTGVIFADLKIYNLAGEQIFCEQLEPMCEYVELLTNNWPSGYYTMVIATDKGVISKSINIVKAK